MKLFFRFILILLLANGVILLALFQMEIIRIIQGVEEDKRVEERLNQGWKAQQRIWSMRLSPNGTTETDLDLLSWSWDESLQKWSLSTAGEVTNDNSIGLPTGKKPPRSFFFIVEGNRLYFSRSASSSAQYGEQLMSMRVSSDEIKLLEAAFDADLVLPVKRTESESFLAPFYQRASRSIPILGADRQTIGYFLARNFSSVYPSSPLDYLRYIGMLLGIGSFSLIGMVLFFYAWPLHRILRALVEENVRPLGKLPQRRDEFGTLSRLVAEFLAQKEKLETEIEQRLKSEKKLAAKEKDLVRSIEEKASLLRDLHDDLIQQLYALGLRMESMREGDGTKKELDREWIDLRKLVNQLIAQVRTYIEMPNLAPDTISLEKFLLSLSNELSSQFSINLSVHSEVEGLYPNDSTRKELSSILRESASNSYRHGQASSIRILIQHEKKGVRLRIEDDGSGFDVVNCQPGQGIENMKTRAERLGAHFEITSLANEGTCIQLVWAS
ncbi:MAG: ATP-binding protein [Verrucomicrobiota bacterium]